MAALAGRTIKEVVKNEVQGRNLSITEVIFTDGTASLSSNHDEAFITQRESGLCAAQVAGKIGVPLQDWPGNCFAIATRTVEAGVVDGRAVYGHYLGPVAEGSIFFGRRLIRHGWILTAAGRIIDPTRWVFDNAPPYILDTAAQDPAYDEGGNRLMQAMQRPAPDHDATGKRVVLPSEVQDLVTTLLGRSAPQTHLCWAEAHWLATLSLGVLGEHAQAVYESLAAAGFQALIPWDNRIKVLGAPSTKYGETA